MSNPEENAESTSPTRSIFPIGLPSLQHTIGMQESDTSDTSLIDIGGSRVWTGITSFLMLPRKASVRSSRSRMVSASHMSHPEILGMLTTGALNLFSERLTESMRSAF